MRTTLKAYKMILQAFQHLYQNVFRITDAGDNRITDGGDTRITDDSDY
jgi:hypothetical protein